MAEGILETLGDFTSKENWDKFFTLRGAGDSFEWYAEWPTLRDPLLSHLAGAPAILVPGCGSSRVSEHLYDTGFRQITNIDFSKVAVSEMLRRNVRSRPEMRWRVMDMTDMQFGDEFFDIILDKGGLDALMEPEVGSKLGTKYLKEVKRVLKSGGKFLCLTLAESHVVGLVLSEFRFGWVTSIQAIPHKPSNQASFQTFIVAIVKEKFGASSSVVSLSDCHALDSKTRQIRTLVDAVETENKIRSECSSCDGVIYSLEDLKLGAKEHLEELYPGQRFQLILGEQGASLYSYKAVLLDAHPQPDPFLYGYGVFIVPKTRAHEWLFTSEEGQWLVVESSKTARLIMVFLDSRHSHANMDIIKKDLSPLVKNLAPGKDDNEAQIPFLTATDGVKERKTVKQVKSMITGTITVEDVIYENVDGDDDCIFPSKASLFRRLIFERSSGLVQSEALLTREKSQSNLGEAERKGNNLSLKSKQKGARKRSNSSMLVDGSKNNLKVDHRFLASSYHTGIISGLALISSTLENLFSLQQKVKTIIIGLGAGLLPMHIHECLPAMDIEVVELDPIMLDLANDCFGFKEDKKLKVHIGDGIKFIQDHVMESSDITIKHKRDDVDLDLQTYDNSLSNGSSNTGYKILIVDADSSDLSSALTCPPADFVDEPFLVTVNAFLSEGGLFVTNLVSRSPAIKNGVVSRMKAVFNQVFSLQLGEDVNEVLFAFPGKEDIDVDHFADSMAQLRSLIKVPLPIGQSETSKFKRLK